MNFTYKIKGGMGELFAAALNSGSGETFEAEAMHGLQADGVCVRIPGYGDHCSCWTDDDEECCWCTYNGYEARPCVAPSGGTILFLPDLVALARAGVEPAEPDEADEDPAAKIERLEVLVGALSNKLAMYELVAPLIDAHIQSIEENKALWDKVRGRR